MDYSKLSDSTLDAIANGKPLDYSKLSDEELEVLASAKPASPAKEPVLVSGAKAVVKATPDIIKSLLETTGDFGRGAAQGATFGFADEISGGIESALTDKTYEQARDESRANFTAAEAASPIASFAGNMAGAIGSGMLTGGAGAVTSLGRGAIASGLAKAAAAGAASGGLTGAGMSEAKNPDDLTIDSLNGATYGAMFGAGIPLIGAAAKGGANFLGGQLTKKAKDSQYASDVIRSWSDGAEGTRVFGQAAKNRYQQGALDAAQDTSDEVSDAVKKWQGEKNLGLTKASEEGKTLDLSNVLSGYLDDVKQTNKGMYSREDLKELTETIQDLIEGGNLSNADLFDVEDIARNLYGRGSRFDKQSPLLKGLAKKIRTSVAGDDVVEGIVPETKVANQKLTSLFDIQDVIGKPENYRSLSPADQEKVSNKLLNIVQNMDDPTLIQSKSNTTLMELVDQFDPAMKKKIEEKMRKASSDYAFSRRIEGTESLGQSKVTQVMGGSRNALLKGVNVAGLTGNALGKARAGAVNKFNSLVDRDPAYLKTLADKLALRGPEGQQLSQILKTAEGRDRIGRNALLFAAEQNPAFRSLINEDTDTAQ